MGRCGGETTGVGTAGLQKALQAVLWMVDLEDMGDFEELRAKEWHKQVCIL